MTTTKRADGTWMVGDTTHDGDTLRAASPDHLEQSLLPLLDLV